MSEAILFDRDRVERLEELGERPRRLRRNELLWVDVDRSASAAADVTRAFELEQATHKHLAIPSKRALFEDHGHYIHVTAYAPRDDELGELHALDCIVGDKWVVTAHEQPIPVLEDFADRVSGAGDVGSLDGPGFLAALLEWVLGAYSDAFERLEERLEELDILAMRGDGDAEKDIERLVEMRQDVGELRRALAAHRAALVALTHPELDAIGDDASRERFQSLLQRFETTMQEARDARESIVGSFDVLIARGGQRTNEIMKVLTLASVILLPGALLASVMGMNFKVGLFDEPALFWVTVAAIVAVAPLTIVLAKRRDWI